MKKIIGTILLGTISFAQTFYVSTTSDFREALETSTLNGENDKIILTTGTYNIMDDNHGTFIYSSNEEYNLTIESSSNEKNSVILDGNNTDQILYFNNTNDFTVKLKNITLLNGFNENESGAIKTPYNLELEDVNITNNTAKNGSVFALNATLNNSIISNNMSNGLYVKNLNMKNSLITNNQGSGIYFHSYGNSTIIDSNISNNSDNGILIDSANLTIHNSNISNNDKRGISSSISTANVFLRDSNISNNGTTGLYIYSHGTMFVDSCEISYNNYGLLKNNSNSTFIVLNSKIFNNYTKGFEGYMQSNNIILLNNTFAYNPIGYDGSGLILNNIFYENNTTDIAASPMKTYIFNNYINYNKLTESTSDYATILKKDNIHAENITISLNSSLNVDSMQDTLDVGFNPSNTKFIEYIDEFLEDTEHKDLLYNSLNTDILGNKRIYNNTIDLGAYEYGAPKYTTTIPSILISKSGDEKIYSNLTLDLNVTLTDNRTIESLEIDDGSGVYETIADSTTQYYISFNTAGTKTIKVKVTDNEGEIGEQILNINILDLTVQEAIEYGKQQCIDDPSSCGITGESTSISNDDINTLNSGWHLMGTASQLTASEIAGSNVKTIWSYEQGWNAYSPDNTLKSAITESGIELLDTIGENKGFWINIK